MAPYTLQDEIEILILRAKEEESSREMSLVITKLQEALFWLKEAASIPYKKD